MGTDNERWDLVVLGGGTAGIVAAKTAARFGVRTLLVERERTGGDCLWTGCVPSKALIAAADAAAGVRAARRLGVHASDPQVDLAQVMGHVRAAITTIAPIDSPAALEEAGVTVIAGHGRFTGPGRIDVDGTTFAFAQAIVATGAAPLVPDVPGLGAADPLTSDTVWSLRAAPARLAVLGGGTIGCELGQALARLGSEVTLVEAGPGLLPREDADAGDAVERSLRADGVRVLTGRTVVRVEQVGAASRLHLAPPPGAGTSEHVDVDRILVAAGRRPRTDDLGLGTVGIEVDELGHIRVDDRLRTSARRIRAAGDVTGHPGFTHVAGVHGSLAASNAVLGVRRRIDPVVPRVTYTRPEVAAVGVDTGAGRPDGIRVVTVGHRDVDRAVAEADTDGFTRLALDRRGRIVGATVVGPRAGESVAELVLAVRRGLRSRDLAAVVHAYPTYNDGAWNAAIADVRSQLESPRARRVIRVLVGLRRQRMRRGR